MNGRCDTVKQVISFIAAIQGKTGTDQDQIQNKPRFLWQLSKYRNIEDEVGSRRKVVLIIGLASIIDNWAEELNTWGYFSVGYDSR